jgi:23S rRNA G2445 N2-methylase RlmL
MKLLVLFEKDFFNLVKKEINELVAKEITELSNQSGIIELDKEEIDLLHSRGQSFQGLIILFGETGLDYELNYNDYFNPTDKVKVEVFNLKGNDNRIDKSQEVANQFFKHIDLEVDLKSPDKLIIAYCLENKYYYGLSLNKKELGKRDYRVFVNSSSLRGDVAYKLIREIDYNQNEKLWVENCKDGVIPIEATIFINQLNCKNNTKEQKIIVDCYDKIFQNLNSTKKNARFAGVKLNYSNKGEYTQIICQINKKDEDYINEIFEKVSQNLKDGGKILFLTRTGFDLPYPSNYDLLVKQGINQGQSEYNYYILKKKA